MFGERLRTLRKENNLTLEEFGKKINLGKSTISQYENNINEPDFEILTKIASYFDVTTDYLLGLSRHRNLSSKDQKEIDEDVIDLKNQLDGLPEDLRSKVIENIKSQVETAKQALKYKNNA